MCIEGLNFTRYYRFCLLNKYLTITGCNIQIARARRAVVTGPNHFTLSGGFCAVILRAVRAERVLAVIKQSEAEMLR